MNTPLKRHHIAIVIPWYGEDLKGGAEQLAWHLSTHLHDLGIRVTILTTCCQSFYEDWNTNHHREGSTEVEHAEVLRFRVKKRDEQLFSRVVGLLLNRDPQDFLPTCLPLNKQDEQAYWDNNIYSEDLQKHLERHHDRYDYVIFLPGWTTNPKS